MNLRVTPKMKHADIVRCIRLVRALLPLQLTFKHIKAHQDDYILYDSLNHMPKRNMDCDLLAKTGLTRLHQINAVRPDFLPHEQIVARIRGGNHGRSR